MFFSPRVTNNSNRRGCRFVFNDAQTRLRYNIKRSSNEAQKQLRRNSDEPGQMKPMRTERKGRANKRGEDRRGEILADEKEDESRRRPVEEVAAKPVLKDETFGGGNAEPDEEYKTEGATRKCCCRSIGAGPEGFDSTVRCGMEHEVCMNIWCNDGSSREWKKGWPLRSAGFARLCEDCG
ncbi:hypothetical protein Fmac_031244 [Flemingia macrophylla]|uniref:Uncharacterized protein n=1 Tax=Flemingia macrophylla TaxID=520843 RepID=A0ABD1L1H3_9FABA